MKAILLFILFAVLSAAGSYAQSAAIPGGEEGGKPRKVALFFDVARFDAESNARIMVYQSLLQDVRRVSPKAELLEYARQHGSPLAGTFPAVPKSEQAVNSTALAENADSWLLVSLEGSAASVTITYRFVDLLASENSVSGSYRTSVDSRYRNLSGGLWSRLNLVLKEPLKARQISVNINFTGVPGTAIQETTIKSMHLKIAEDGTGTLSVPAPGAYRFAVERAGYYPAEVPVKVGQSAVDVPLDMHQKSRFSFDFAFTDFSFPSLRTDFAIFPEALFTRLALETYLVGIVPLGARATNGTRVFIASYGVTYVTLGIGGYLSGPLGVWKGTFRPYVAASGLLRVVTIPAYFGIDPLLPGGAEVEVGTELLPQSPIRGVIALSARVFFASDGTLAASQVPQDSQWKFHAYSWGIIEFPSLVIGVRFQP